MAEQNPGDQKKVADRYLKREVLGEGTYRVVFKAIDTKGSSDIDQLGKIFAAFGTPNLPSRLIWFTFQIMFEYQFVPAPPLRSLFPMASEVALEILSRMFTYDPKTRISVQQALQHRYFTSVPAPTKPQLLPRPAPKEGDSFNPRPDLNAQDVPVVLSPPRKSKRVMLHRDQLEANASEMEKAGERASGIKQVGEATGQSTNHMPMSIDLAAAFNQGLLLDQH